MRGDEPLLSVTLSSSAEKIAFHLMASASAFIEPSWPMSLAVNCGGAASFGSRLSRRSAISCAMMSRSSNRRCGVASQARCKCSSRDSTRDREHSAAAYPTFHRAACDSPRRDRLR